MKKKKKIPQPVFFSNTFRRASRPGSGGGVGRGFTHHQVLTFNDILSEKAKAVCLTVRWKVGLLACPALAACNEIYLISP